MDDITANDLLREAIQELDKVHSGDTFIVKDLFQGIRWNRFPRNERLLLGTLFLNLHAHTLGTTINETVQTVGC